MIGGLEFGLNVNFRGEGVGGSYIWGRHIYGEELSENLH